MPCGLVDRQGTIRPVRIAVAAPNSAAVRAGMDVANAGGTAVDAAVAAILVAASTEPGVVSLLGGAYVAVWPSDGEPEVIDGNVEMPGRNQPRARFGHGLREVTTTYGGGLTLYAGPGSVATPGTLAGLALAHERHGRLPWFEVVTPATEVVRAGYRLGAAAASYLAITADTLFAWDAETSALLHRQDGSPVATGDLIVDDNLASTLARIAEHGAQDVYEGEIARLIAQDMRRRGGLLSAADLAAYRPIVRPALRVPAGTWDLATNPPPSIGGPVLAVMLMELGRRQGWDIGDVIEIQRLVLGHRRRVHDVAPDLKLAGRDLLEAVERHGLAGLPTSSSTAHVSVVDGEGTACSITASAGYGSGATVPGTGLMLNNCLGEPELNRLGLHALAPGTRLASNMAPTVARAGSGRVLAVGSPGADRITTALMQVLGRHCLTDADLGEAITHPRVHVSVDDRGSAVVQHEDDPELAQAAARSGLSAVTHPARSMFFGGVGAAYRTADGELGAAADRRRESATGTT